MAPNLIQNNLKLWFKARDLELPPVFLVGGAVRDHLLQRSSNDLDLACKDAEGFAQRLANACGASMVRFEKKPGESCYRLVQRRNRQNILDLVELRDGDIFSDLARRDFTINAMAMRIHSGGRLGELVDPLGGQSDLEEKIVRMAGPEVFADDPLRVLRAWRFAAELGYRIDEATRKCLAFHTKKLRAVAVERIVFELFRILSAGNASKFVREMATLKVLDALFPEKLDRPEVFVRPPVWDGALAVLDSCETILGSMNAYFGKTTRFVAENFAGDNHLPLLKLAVFFYDACRTETSAVETMSEGIARRLKLSNRDRGYFQRVLAGLTDVFTWVEGQKDRSALIGFFRTYGDDGTGAIVIALAAMAADTAGIPDGIDRQQGSKRLCLAVMEYFGGIRAKLLEPDLIGGSDLIAIGMKPGRQMGAVLREVRSAQDLGIVTSREDALELAASLYSENGQ